MFTCSFVLNRKETHISVFAEIRLSATFQWLKCTEWQAHYSDNSVNFLAIQPHFSHHTVILLLRNIKFNYLSLNYAENNTQTVFKHTVILIVAVLTLLAIVYWVNSFLCMYYLAFSVLAWNNSSNKHGNQNNCTRWLAWLRHMLMTQMYYSWRTSIMKKTFAKMNTH